MDSISGARADHEAPPSDARENWEVWAVDIKDELNEYATQYKPSRPSTSETISKIKPSIFDGKWDYSINQFQIGMLFYNRDYGNREVRNHMLGNAAFMIRWLGLDINRCVQFIDENQDLARDHYACRPHDEMQHEVRYWFYFSTHSFLGGSGGSSVKDLLLASCSLCFAILLFQKVRNGTQILNGTAENNSDLTDERSLEFLSLYRVIMRDLMRTKLDMLNLTNQIPWFVVEAVFANSNLSKRFGTSLDRLAMTCFDDLYPRANKSKVQSGSIPSGGFKHLLHIFHWTRTPEGNKWLVDTKLEQEDSLKRFDEFYIPNATNLLGSATTFKRLDGGSLDVIFSKKRVSGAMQLTPLHLFPYSHEMLRDLLIFEQIYLDCGLSFTAHFACMKSLLQTKEDVGLLQKNGIVQNTLTGEEDVLSFVRDMGKFLRDDLNARIPEDLNRLSEEVIKHHDNTASREYYEFKCQFCPSRWVFISIIAATTLFVLTIIQTIYTGLGYYKS